jgi:hypothetical protein
MKAQIATIESIIATAMLFSATSVYAYLAYEVSSMQGYANSYNLIYSFVNAAYYNSTFKSCLNLYNQRCILNFLMSLRQVYGASSITLTTGSGDLTVGNTTGRCYQKQAYCILLENNTSNIACIYLCGV